MVVFFEWYFLMSDKHIKSPTMPLVIRFAVFMHDLLSDVCIRPDGTFNRRLYSLIDFKASAPATKIINTARVSTSDITVEPARGLWFRLFIPSSNSDKLLPLIVYFHGGGFTNGGADGRFFDNLCSHLAARVPAVVASVNYRLAPEHKYPSQYEDGLDVLKFIDANYSSILPKTDLSKCFIGGDSAGGTIAHHVTIRALQSHEKVGTIRIVGILELQPFFGGEERTESELRFARAPILTVKLADAYWRGFLPEGADRNHPAAHVFGGGANSEAAVALKNLDFPATLVIVGGHDPLQDWDRRYVEWLKSCGKRAKLIEYQNAFHASYLFQQLPEFALIIDDMANFVHEQVNSN